MSEYNRPHPKMWTIWVEKGVAMINRMSSTKLGGWDQASKDNVPSVTVERIRRELNLHLEKNNLSYQKFASILLDYMLSELKDVSSALNLDDAAIKEIVVKNCPMKSKIHQFSKRPSETLNLHYINTLANFFGIRYTTENYHPAADYVKEAGRG